MQKPLNTHPFSLFSLARRLPQLLLGTRASLVTVLVVLLASLSISSAQAAAFTSNLVFITGSRGGTAITPLTFYTPGTTASSGATVQFTVANPLGSFNRTAAGLDELYINAESNTTAGTGETVSPPNFYYRVLRKDTLDNNNSGAFSTGGYIPLQLGFVSGSPSGTAKWSSNLANRINLIQYAATPGDYIIQVYFQANYTVAGTLGNPSTTGNLFDGTSAQPYANTFYQYVNGERFVRATWNGATNRQWFEATNWSNGRVPASNTDVTISRNTTAAYPIISATDNPAQVHNIVLAGTSAAQKALLNLNGSSLSVFGNFQDAFGGFTELEAGVLYLSSSESQVFDESSRIANPFSIFNLGLTGLGTKSITAPIIIKSRLVFSSPDFFGMPTSGPLITGNFNINLGSTGVLVNEMDGASVQGTVISARMVNNNETADFGNIGVTLTTNKDNTAAISPGFTTVTRSNYVYFGTGTSQSINRSFEFLPARGNISQFDLTFKYLTSELNGIPVDNLLLFRSDNGDIPFEGLGKSSTAPNTLIRNGISGNLAALFTLGNRDNPLPVTITSFTAVAQGADAVLNWATASETNNQGFEVQVSTDGTTFNKLGFLAANTPNSSTPHAYQYRDVTAGKQGVRYYRLRQLDLDGTASFVGPRAVTFGDVAQATSLQGYPSPFSSEINLALQTTTAGLATVTVTDGVGRQVRAWQPTVAAGASSLRLTDLQNMPAGLYIVQVRYNDGQTQRLKMVKE